MALGDTDTFTADEQNPPDYASRDGGPISDTATATSPVTERPKDSGVMIRPMQAQQSSRPSLPQPNLDRAYHTLDFLQRNPQWLANPYTKHAAEAILQNSSKMIEMSIQLERVNAMADSAKLKLNTDTRLVNHLNDGLAKLKDMTVVAAIRDEVQANGPSPLAISMLNTQLEKESPAGIATTLTMGDGTQLQGFRDKFGNFHQSAVQTIQEKESAIASNIDKRFANQKGLADIKFQNSKALMKEKDFWSGLATEEKSILSRYDKDYSNVLKEIVNFQKAGVLETDPRMAGARARASMVALKQQKFLDAVRHEPTSTATTTAASTSTNAPASAAETQEGQIYKGYKFLGGDKSDKSNWQPVQP